MVLMFAIMGIVFSASELIARPFVHNYNKGWIFFSLNTWLGAPQNFLQIALTIYASFYLLMVSFVAVQFLFRYFTLVNPNVAKKFSGKGMILWISYCVSSGLIYGGFLYLLGYPDDYSDEYMRFSDFERNFCSCEFREEILTTYGFAVKELPRIQMIPYAADGSFRIGNVMFIVIGGLDLVLQYSIIISCGIRMHLVMRREFMTASTPNKRLQKQFFRALIVQTIVPSILFVTPAAGVLLSPLLDIRMSLQTGWIYASLSLYPSIDSIAFMLLISEYRKVSKGNPLFQNKPTYFIDIQMMEIVFPKKPLRMNEGISTVDKS